MTFGQEEGEHLPDIKDISNINNNKDIKYNNIIYYDENIDFISSVYQDCDYLERNTPGAFIICTNLDQLNFIKEEILRENRKEKRIAFNAITSGNL